MLKSTGIVRRVDDLGRVVVPRQLRHTLGIQNGDPIEYLVSEDGDIIIRKYDPDTDGDC